MKKLILSVVLSIFCLVVYSQTYDIFISGVVTDEITGEPIFGQEVNIFADSLTGGFMYFNTVVTGDGGYYEDIMQVPIGIQGNVEVSTNSCGILITQSDFFSQNTSQLFFDFIICTDPSGNDCQAMYYYYPGYEPFSIQFIDESWGNINSWQWDFGDGNTSNEQDPLHYYNQGGDYLTSLTISGDSCQSMLEMLVRVDFDTIGDCEAFYYYYPGIEELSIEFFDASIGNVVNWNWDFGDGNVSFAQNPVHTYDFTGEYIVSLTIETADSCTSYFENFVIVENDTTYCIAAFNVELDTLNNTPHTYIFTDLSEGEFEFWYWDFGDGNFSFDQNPVHVYDDGGNYDVCLTISTSPGVGMCTSTQCQQVSTLEYYNFGGQAFIGNYPINIDSTDDANIAIAYLYRKINDNWQYMDHREFWEYGYYWFADKPVGEYIIKTELKENSLDYSNYAPSYYMDAVSWKTARTFTLSNNQQFAVNISFNELATYTSGIGSLSGFVLGGPSCNTMQYINIEHVLIQLFNNQMELIAYTYSDINGNYEFTGLGMGNYYIKAEYTGKYSQEVVSNISDTEPNIDNIELIVHCSHILGVDDEISESFIQISQPYPMPTNNFVNINISSGQVTSGTITIYNINGDMMYNRSINIDMGSQIISAQANTLPPGLYSMQIVLDNYRFQKNYKIIIIH